MGISAQQMLGNDPEYLAKQLRMKQLEGSMAPYETISTKGAGLAGGILGGGIANLFGGRNFFDVSDPALRRVSDVNSIVSAGLKDIDPTNPQAMASTYAAISKQLADAGYAQPAALAAQEAGKYTTKAAELAKKNMPGAVKPSDVGSFITQARQNLGPLKNQLTSIETGRGYIQAARAGNPKAEAQLDRYLAKASGDSQLSMAEVTTVATAGGFGQRVVDSINKFFTGNAGELTLEQKEEVLNVLEIAAAKRYNDERTSLGTAYTGLLPDYIVESNLPGINVSQQAQDYMKKANKQQAAAAASTPLSPNASKYLGTKPTGTTPVAPNQPITTPIAPRTSVVPSEQDYYNIAP